MIDRQYCTAFEPTHKWDGLLWHQVLDKCNGGLAYTEVLTIWICRTCLRPSKLTWLYKKQRCAVCRKWYTAPELVGECLQCWPDQMSWRQFTSQAKIIKEGLTAPLKPAIVNTSTQLNEGVPVEQPCQSERFSCND